MKKIMTLWMFLFITAHLFAQSPLKHNNATTTQQLVIEKMGQHYQLPILPPTHGNETQLLTVKERLDSMIMELNMGMWTPMQKMLYFWNAQLLINKQEEHEFDASMMKWVPTRRELFDYNTNGEMTERLLEDYDPALNQWIGSYKTVYTWNNGKLSTSAVWNWDVMANTWVDNGRETYYYLPNGYLSYIIYEFWDGMTNQWEIGYKQELTYNASNQITVDMYSFWDVTLQQYYPGGKDEYTYHTNGNVSLVTSSFYDVLEMAWIPERKIENNYDANANKTMVTESYYDPYDSLWIYSEQEVNTYDALNNLITGSISLWDETTNSWEPQSKGLYTYDNSVPYAMLLLPSTFIEDGSAVYFKHKLTDMDVQFYDPTIQTWLPILRAELFWSTVSIGIEKTTPMADLKAIPNPAKDVITIAGEHVATPLYLRVTDMKGQTVLQQQVLVGEQVGISHLRPGIYLYQIGDGIRLLQQNKLLITR